MTAPVLNMSSIAPAGAATGAAAAAAVSPVAGFEALLAALFPLGATPGLTPQAAPTGDAEPVDADAGDEALPEAEAPVLGGEAAADAALALIAAQAPATDVAAAAAEVEGEPAPPAWGQAKDRGAPAAPALAHANAHAHLADKAAAAAAASDESAGDVAPEAAPRSPAPVSTDLPDQAVAHGSRAAAPPPATPATVSAAAPASVGEVEPATPPAPPPGEASLPADTAAPPTLASVAANRGAPEPVQGSAKPGRARSEAGKSEPALETASPGAPRAAAAGAQPALAARPAGNPAEADTASIEAAAPPEAEAAEAGAPDFASAMDTQEASQGAPSAGQAAAQAVRGSPETVATLAAQIVKKLDGRSTRFDLELNPQGLGMVDVRVEIGRDGRISAAMAFDNPQAAQELKARAGELTRALEQAGFDMSGGISFDVAGDRGQHARQEWQAPDDTGHGHRGRAFQAALNTAGEADAAATSGALRLRRGVNAGLDVRI